MRAHDLVRYRNFRTLTTPAPQQFLSLAVDPGGEVACAGTLDSFQARGVGWGRLGGGGRAGAVGRGRGGGGGPAGAVGRGRNRPGPQRAEARRARVLRARTPPPPTPRNTRPPRAVERTADLRVERQDRPASGRARRPRGPRLRAGLQPLPADPRVLLVGQDRAAVGRVRRRGLRGDAAARARRAGGGVQVGAAGPPLAAWPAHPCARAPERLFGAWGGSESAGPDLTPHAAAHSLPERPDGRQLAAATLDGAIYLWDAQEGELQVG